MRIRQATRHDAVAMGEIEVSAAPSPWLPGAIEASLDQPHNFGLVAEDNGEIVGQLLASAVVGEGELLIVSVRTDRQGQGVGRALLEALVAEWARRDVSVGFLEVRSDNTAALALYRNCGWVEEGRRPRYYSDGRDAILMRWSR